MNNRTGLYFTQVQRRLPVHCASAPLSRPLHCSTMQIRSGGRSKPQRAAHRESSDPHRLWDQVYNVRDQYTQGIVSLSLSQRLVTIWLLSTKRTLVLTKILDSFGYHGPISEGLAAILYSHDLMVLWNERKCSINVKAWWETCQTMSAAFNDTVLFHDL